MIAKWIIGSCIMINNHVYEIKDIKTNTYLLQQEVTIFEQIRQFRESWKIKYVDENAVKVTLFPGSKCRDN